MWRRGGIGVLVTGAALAAAAAPASAEPMVGIVGGPGSALVTFDSAQPGIYTSLHSINGLLGGVGEEIVGIDFRSNPLLQPDAAATEAAKRLYAVSVVDGGGTDTLRLYTIDPGNGNATLVGSSFNVTGGDGYGVDFNHTVDRLRIVNDGDENLRVHPDTAVLTPDTDLTPSRDVAAVAYDRVDTDAATGTTLYGLSSTTGELVTVGGLELEPEPERRRAERGRRNRPGRVLRRRERQLRHLADRRRLRDRAGEPDHRPVLLQRQPHDRRDDAGRAHRDRAARPRGRAGLERRLQRRDLQRERERRVGHDHGHAQRPAEPDDRRHLLRQRRVGLRPAAVRGGPGHQDVHRAGRQRHDRRPRPFRHAAADGRRRADDDRRRRHADRHRR